jgi:hypothetical protein
VEEDENTETDKLNDVHFEGFAEIRVAEEQQQQHQQQQQQQQHQQQQSLNPKSSEQKVSFVFKGNYYVSVSNNSKFNSFSSNNSGFFLRWRPFN